MSLTSHLLDYIEGLFNQILSASSSDDEKLELPAIYTDNLGDSPIILQFLNIVYQTI